MGCLVLVPAVAGGAPHGAHRAGEHVEEEQASGRLPAAQVAGARGPPVVGRELGRMGADDPGDLGDLGRGHAADPLGLLGRVGGVVVCQSGAHRVDLHRAVRVALAQIDLPVTPAPHEVALPCAVEHQQPGDGQQQEGLGAGPCRQPVVGLRAGIGESGVDADDRRPLALGFDDPLGVRVEVMARFQVRRDEEDHFGVGEVRRRAVMAHPALVADTGVGAADVGVAVVAVHPPALEHPLGVAVLAGAAHVVHDLVVAAFGDGGADAATDVVEGLVPAHPLPLPGAPLPGLPQRVQDALVVVDLVERGRTLGTVATPAGRMQGVALDAVDAPGGVVDMAQQPAGGLAVETGGGHQGVMVLLPAGPGLGVERGDVVPGLVRGVAVQFRHGAISPWECAE